MRIDDLDCYPADGVRWHVMVSVPHTREKLIASFWRRVGVGKADECWPWRGAIRANGYGNARLIDGNRRAQTGAHRLAFHLYSGAPIPADLFVLHSCDNPPCCNPAHLRLGTPRENSQDAKARRRNPSWTRTHCPKGHAYEEHNLLFTVEDGRSRRRCKTCQNLSLKRRKDLKRNEAIANGTYTPPTGLRTTYPRGHPYDHITGMGRRACSICAKEASRRSKKKRSAQADHA